MPIVGNSAIKHHYEGMTWAVMRVQVLSAGELMLSRSIRKYTETSSRGKDLHVISKGYYHSDGLKEQRHDLCARRPKYILCALMYRHLGDYPHGRAMHRDLDIPWLPT